MTKQVLKVIHNTFFKLETKQSSELPTEAIALIEAGKEFEIHSYAYADATGDFNGHVKFALKNPKDLIRGRNTWYAYGKHIEVEFDGEQVYPQEEEAARLVLEIDQNTILKRQPVDAAKLPADQKVSIAKGKTFDLHSYAFADAKGSFNGHIKFAIADKEDYVNGMSTWYVSEKDAHVEFNEEIVYPLAKRSDAEEAKPAAAPAPRPVVAPKPAADPIPPVLPRYAARSVRLPDGRTVSTTDPIVAGGAFTWGHATHGGERPPQTVEHMQNIVRLAGEMEKVRRQFGRQIRVTSWYRPEPFNSRVGGARRSQHLSGRGIDITIPGMMGREVGTAVLPWWNGGLGIYPGNRKHILHLDIGPKRRWGF